MSGNTDTVTNTISEPSEPLPNTQSIPMEKQSQPQNVAILKELTPGLSIEETNASMLSEMIKKPGAFSGEQILEILNNPPIIVLK